MVLIMAAIGVEFVANGLKQIFLLLSRADIAERHDVVNQNHWRGGPL